jgi:rhamnosyltransferase
LFSPAGLRAAAGERLKRGAARRVPRATTAAVRRPPPPQPVTRSVSVVVPTRNAGPLFARVLAAVRAQEGVPAIEIVVVDSGSSDGTVELARRHGATVVDVEPSDFGHGRTRNAGAEAAGGDVLLLLVQDAILLGADAIRTLVAELEADATLAAVSARQVPRTDVDLFGAFTIYAHDRLVRDSSPRSAGGSAARRRARGSLDNVCAAIRRETWAELRFSEVSFAEDLDFGLRAVAAGWGVRVSRAAAVAHSHVRSAEYQFRRGVAERIAVASLVDDERHARAAGAAPDEVLAAAPYLLAQVQGALAAPTEGEPLAAGLEAVRRSLARRPKAEPPGGELAALASLFADFASGPRERPLGLLRDDLLALLAWRPLREFAGSYPAVAAADVSAFVSRLAASSLGRSVADAYRRRGEEPPRSLLQGV